MASILPFHRRSGRGATPADRGGEALTDEALVAASAVGDTAALGVLFDRFSADVYRFLFRVAGGDVQELEDLVQRTFLEVHRSARRFRGESSVRQWIFGIAANLSRHQVRSAVRRRAALRVLSDAPSAAVLRPDQLVERQQLLARVLEVLPSLTHELRSAFVLCELEEFSGVDAARILGIREGTLRRRLHDARRSLRRALQGEDP